VGIDIQQLNFLRYVHKFGNFNKTITIGRQNIYTRFPIKKLIPINTKYENGTYVDQLLKDYFGSTIVDSIDASDYENATIIHDLNTPIPENLKYKYDTVIDSGTLEHIYNIPQALENVSFLCRPEGQIIHILPANNQCGHGFWQMSPELFFSLFSDKNGYEDTEVYLASPGNARQNFYKVIKPENGSRVNIYSKYELYVYVRTVLKTMEFSHKNVQQSDYMYYWNNRNNKESMSNSSLKNFISNYSLTDNLAVHVYSTYNRLRNTNRLTRYNPNLIKIKITSLISDQGQS
jgi:hypothetical protein